METLSPLRTGGTRVALARRVGILGWMAGLDRGFALIPGPSPRGEKGAGFFVRGWGEMAELAGSVGLLHGL